MHQGEGGGGTIGASEMSGSADFFRAGSACFNGAQQGQRGQRYAFGSPPVTPVPSYVLGGAFSALGNVMTHFMMHNHSNYSHSAACVCVRTIDRNMARTGSGWLCWFEVGGRKKNGNYAGVVLRKLVTTWVGIS